MNFIRRSPMLVALTLLLAAPPVARAGHGCATCGTSVPCGQPAHCESGPQYVEQTIMVPQWDTERRTINVTEYAQEQRTRTYTAYRCVPRTEQVSRDVTIMVPVTKTKTLTETVHVPVYSDQVQHYTVRVPKYRTVERQVTVTVPHWREEEKQYTVMVPVQERRTGTRMVCHMEPVTETRTITRDTGHWEEQTVEVPTTSCGHYSYCAPKRRMFFRNRSACYTSCDTCNTCATCGGGSDCGSDCGSGCGEQPCGGLTTVTRKVWVPNIETDEQQVTVMRPKMVEQQYEYSVTVCRPETKTRMVRVCDYRQEQRTVTHRVCDYVNETRERTVRVCNMQPQQRTRQVNYTVCQPKTVTRTHNVTRYEQVAEEKTATYTVCVPHQVQKEVEVPVCRMVPKTVTVPVSTGGCDSGHCGGGWSYGRRLCRRGC
jgi:hypothetical protein